jgi:hypothetical protein
MRSAGLQRWQPCFPSSLAIGARTRAASSQRNAHILARLRTTPDTDRLVPLQHRVVLEHGMQQRRIGWGSRADGVETQQYG